MHEVQPDIRRLLVIHNPHGTNAHRFERVVVKPLMESGRKYDLFETENPALPGVDNVAAAVDQFEPGDILVVSGGDETQELGAQIVRKAVKLDKISADKTGIISIPNGAGNDFSRSANGGQNIAKGNLFMRTVEDGVYRWVNGVQLETKRKTPEDVLDVSIDEGLTYVSWGYTAKIARKMGTERMRWLKHDTPLKYISNKPVDAIPTLIATATKKPFEFTQNGEDEVAIERIYSVVPSLGGGMLKMNVDPFADKLVEFTFRTARFIRNGVHAAYISARGGAIEGTEVDGANLTINSDTDGQLGGRYFKVHRGTAFSVARLPDFVQVVTLAA